MNSDTLKTYYTDEYLGSAYINDEYGINNGYPILKWQENTIPIIANASVDDAGENIIIEVTHNINDILNVRNENGTSLPRLIEIGKIKYIETAINGDHTYTITDSEGNTKQINFKIRMLNSANSLKDFRDEVNNGTSFEGCTIIQTADIDMSSVCGEDNPWVPIGTTETKFAGTYDGKFHTISNLYVGNGTKIGTVAYAGLFSSTKLSTIIKNVVMENVYVYNSYVDSETYNYTGAIVGTNNGKIEKCSVESGSVITVKDNTYTSYFNCLTGGISGMNSGTIDQCYNKAYVSTERHNSSSGLQALAGGITGHLNKNGVITNSYNAGNVNVSGYNTIIGGICGEKGGEGSSTIKNCYNVGSISNASNQGGIIGRHWDGSVTVTNTYSLTSTNFGTQVNTSTLKTYSSTLGSAYTNDDGRNNGYPILAWQTERE